MKVGRRKLPATSKKKIFYSQSLGSNDDVTAKYLDISGTMTGFRRSLVLVYT